MYERIKTPRGFLKVEKPDHPFTFDGPDILLSNKRGLIAVFELRPNDGTSERELISRLVNSMVAYPAETQMVLLIDNRNKDDQVEKLEGRFFNRIIELSD